MHEVFARVPRLRYYESIGGCSLKCKTMFRGTIGLKAVCHVTLTCTPPVDSPNLPQSLVAIIFVLLPTSLNRALCS